MYEFAIMLFGGLLVMKTVDLFRGLTKELDRKGGMVFFAALVGVGYAYLFDFSLFAAWNASVRADWIGTLATGLFLGALAGSWHTVLNWVHEWAHRYHSEASETEARLHRAA